MGLLTPNWFTFHLALQDRADADFLVAYRCPECGALIDWRAHADHLRSHGITDEEQIAEAVKRQEQWAGIS